MKLISLWSGPRNVSTALMYSFAQRKDMKVVDEPLYGYYLEKTGVDHPGRDEILNHMETDPVSILREICHSKKDSHIFLKNMAHHAIDLSEEWFTNPEPLFLIRDPWEMLPSLAIQIPDPTLRDTALKKQVQLWKKLVKLGKEPIVVDSRDLLNNIEEILKMICEHLKIDFLRPMLEWEPGPIPEDGIWARHWYDQVHASSGFKPNREKNREAFPKKLRPLLEECLPYYKFLSDKKLSI